MGIYYGKSSDGSDIREFEGMHVSPNGKYWGTEVITLEDEEKMDKAFTSKKLVRKHCNRKMLRSQKFGY